MKTKDVRKGMEIKTPQLGLPISGVMMDSYGNRKTRLINTKGTEVGLFDEIGSVYSYDIYMAQDIDSGGWHKIEHTEKELKMKKDLDEWYDNHDGLPENAL